MKLLFLSTLKVLLMMSLMISIIQAKTVSVNDIITQTNLSAFYQGEDARAVARMKIIDNQGRIQIRQFNILRRDIKDGGDQQFLIAFSRPSDVKGMMFRVEKHTTNHDDRWLYLPALDLVKRISASDKRTSFVGSNFYYEDISGRNTTLDNFTLVSQSANQYVINAVPKDASAVEFVSYQLTIDKSSMLPIKISYTNNTGAIYRIIEALSIKVIDGFHTVTSSRVSLPLTGARTLMQFKGIKYNNDLPSSVFSERSLRNPPTRWFK